MNKIRIIHALHELMKTAPPGQDLECSLNFSGGEKITNLLQLQNGALAIVTERTWTEEEQEVEIEQFLQLIWAVICEVGTQANTHHGGKDGNSEDVAAKVLSFFCVQLFSIFDNRMNGTPSFSVRRLKQDPLSGTCVGYGPELSGLLSELFMAAGQKFHANQVANSEGSDKGENGG